MVNDPLMNHVDSASATVVVCLPYVLVIVVQCSHFDSASSNQQWSETKHNTHQYTNTQQTYKNKLKSRSHLKPDLLVAAWDSSKKPSNTFLKHNKYLKFSKRQLEKQTLTFSPANRIRQHRSNPGWSGFFHWFEAFQAIRVVIRVAESSSAAVFISNGNQLSCTIRSRRGSTGLGNFFAPPDGWLMTWRVSNGAQFHDLSSTRGSKASVQQCVPPLWGIKI